MNTRTVVALSCVICVFLAVAPGTSGAVEPVNAEATPSLSNSSLIESDRADSQTGTSINVTVDKEPVPDGGRIITGDDPKISFTINSTSQIESIVLRIDDQTRSTYSPNGTDFTTSVSPGISNGRHELTILVSGGSTTSYSATIIEDSVAPRINFVEPFRTTGYQPPADNYTLDRSNITLSGDLIDRTPTKRVTIEHIYTYKLVGQKQERSRFVIDSPEGNFSQRLKLGPNRPNQTNGTNYVIVTAEDSHGNKRDHDFILNISDTSPPVIDVSEPVFQYDQSEVAYEIRVRDNVGINSIGRRLGSGNYTGFEAYHQSTDIYEQPESLTLTKRFSARQIADPITLFADDLVGNNQTVSLSIDYEEFIDPQITFNESTTEPRSETRARVGLSISQGRFTRVELESLASDGEIHDVSVLYDGTPRSQLRFTETLGVDSFPATVRVRVTDTAGRERTETYQIDAPTPAPTPQTTTQIPTTNTRVQHTSTPSRTVTEQTAPQEQSVTTAGDSPTASNSSLVGALMRYILSILPYTFGSASAVILLYVVLRKTL